MSRTYGDLIMAANDQIPLTNYYDQIVDKLKVIMEKEKFCDVILIAGIDGKRIPSHRLILAAASDFFEAMFTGSMREATAQEIPIQDIEGETLQTLVTYCHTGKLNLCEDNAEKILSSAHLFQLNSVVKQCQEFLQNQLNPTNCLGIKFLAEQLNCPELETLAQIYISLNFEQVAKSEEFFKLSADQLDELLARDDLNVKMEEDIFLSLMSWVQRDETNRKKDIPKLLLNVRIPLMDSKFISDNVKSVCKDNGCSDVLIEALEWKLSPNNAVKISSKSIKPRTNTAGCLLGLGSGRFEKYYLKSNKCKSMEEMTLEEYGSGAVVWKDKLVIAGGYSNELENFVKTVKYWNVECQSWKQLRPLNFARKSLGLAVFGNSLYAIGGDSKMAWLDIVERLDSLTGSWTTLARMPVALLQVQVAIYDGFIFVEGKNRKLKGHLLRYNPQADKWTDLGETSTGVQTILVIEGDLYGIKYNEIRKYNKSVNTWTTCTTECPYIETACAYNNRMMVVAKDEDDTLQLKEYKPNTNEWINLAPITMNQIYQLIHIPSTAI